MSATLLHEAAGIARAFARERILPRARELERHGGAPGSSVPLVELMRELAEALGLPELAHEAAIDTGANEALLSDPELAGVLLHELTRVLPGFALSFGASLGLCGQSLLRRGTAGQREGRGGAGLSFAESGWWGLAGPPA